MDYLWSWLSDTQLSWPSEVTDVILLPENEGIENQEKSLMDNVTKLSL